MSALCLAAGGVLVRIATTAFTLGWLHSVEKVPIEDDWRIEGDRLRLVESRIKGSGAGIEPAPGARLEGGWYRWEPVDAERREIVLRRSGAAGTGDWTICALGTCQTLGSLLPSDSDPVVLTSCADLAGEPPAR